MSEIPNIVNKIDVAAVRNRSISEIPYPHIKVKEINGCIPLMMSCLVKGSVPVVGEWKGVTRVMARTELCASNLNNLLKVTPFELHISEDRVEFIDNIHDFMEVMVNWIS